MKEYFAFVIDRISSLFGGSKTYQQPVTPEALESEEGGDPERTPSEPDAGISLMEAAELLSSGESLGARVVIAGASHFKAEDVYSAVKEFCGSSEEYSHEDVKRHALFEYDSDTRKLTVFMY